MRKRSEEERAKLARQLERVRDSYGDLSDEELIAQLVSLPDYVTAPMEMTRRLMTSNRELHKALVAFHASSEVADARLVSLTRWIVGLTAALVLLAFALIGLTVVLIAQN